jgi:hypothetical protein
MSFWERWIPVYAVAAVLIVAGVILDILNRRERAAKEPKSPGSSAPKS